MILFSACDNPCLKKKYRVSPEAAAAIPDSVEKLIEGMPAAFDPVAAGDLQADIQFLISGPDGGDWVISISLGRCAVRTGQTAAPSLTIAASGEIWLKIARGEIDRPKALMEGLYTVTGDFTLLQRLPQLFGARGRVRDHSA